MPVKRDEGLRVVELTVENYMGVKAVRIRPSGNVVRIEGRNGAGKSSVIDAIWVAVGGASESGLRPLRDGASKGRACVDLGDMRVERKFTQAGAYLEVSDAAGHKIPRPQEFLSTFYSKTTVDPRVFIDMKPSERRDVLLELTGRRGDVDRLDADRKALYDERTLTNREIKTLEARLRGLPPADDAAAAVAEVDTQALMEDLSASIAADRDAAGMERNLATIRLDAERQNGAVRRLEDDIARLQKELVSARAAAETKAKQVHDAEARLRQTPPSRTAELQSALAEADRTNAAARKQAEAAGVRADLDVKVAEAEAFTSEIARIDEEKRAIINSASLSIGEVEFDDAGVLLIDGRPFDDMSMSERLRASLRIAVSQKPRMRVIRISDGNVFDADSMGEIEAFAADNDYQVWIEHVLDTPDGLGFFIKDGEVEGEPAS